MGRMYMEEQLPSFFSQFITTLFLAILVFVAAMLSSKAQATDVVSSRSFPSRLVYSRESFKADEDGKFISTTGDASISQNALQITTDTSNPKVSLLNKVGRCMFRRSFRIWEKDSGKLISFTSIFDINISPPLNAPGATIKLPGEGLTFLISSDLETPPGSSGGFLGLTNQTHDGNSKNKFIAIEFDTVKEDENQDPSDNHIGLNFNSIKSNKTVNLTDDIKIASGRNYTVWINYTGETKVMDVYMGLKDERKPDNSFLSEKVDLREHLNEYSYFGFSASTGNHTAQLNCILKWDLTVEILPEGTRRNNNRLLIPEIVVPGLVVSVICVLILGYYLHKQRKVNKVNHKLVELRNLPGVPKKYTLKKLKKATNNFDEKLKLGQGGFGVVYKGVFPNASEYKEVAVKKFDRNRLNGTFDFLAELDVINRLRHRHLVRLAGWCSNENGMLLLVYEFMPNGSLDHHLYPGSSKPILKWNHRFNIASGVASALDYLHNHYEQKVVHRDLKPGNILLDLDFNARLGDFGLARLIEHGRNSFSELEGFAGTPGYIAPECFYTGKATIESDVFGFGVVVLELICSKPPRTIFEGSRCLVDWVWKLHGENRISEAIDERLGNDYVFEEAHRLLLVGLACLHPIASERPKTETIFQIISGSIPVPSVSPEKPPFVWQPTDQISSPPCTYETEMEINEEESDYYTPEISVFIPTAIQI